MRATNLRGATGAGLTPSLIENTFVWLPEAYAMDMRDPELERNVPTGVPARVMLATTSRDMLL
jgi:hypothetical protein